MRGDTCTMTATGAYRAAEGAHGEDEERQLRVLVVDDEPDEEAEEALVEWGTYRE
jgi:hypothetical protein